LGLVLSFAPILLAEVLLDGLLVAGIWNRFKKSGYDNPLGAAFRITRIPALIVILALFVIEGGSSQSLKIKELFYTAN
jgi:hypothetical protein